MRESESTNMKFVGSVPVNVVFKSPEQGDSLRIGTSGALRMNRSLLGREDMGRIPSEGRSGAKAEYIWKCPEHVGNSGCVLNHGVGKSDRK